MRKRKEYTEIEHFINDESFINWVYKTRLTDVDFWDQFLEDNPNLNAIIIDAKTIVTGIHFNEQTIAEQKVDKAWEMFEARIKESDTTNNSNLTLFKNKKFLAIAATVVLLVSILTVYFIAPSTTITHKTSFGEILNLKLPDGTDVALNSNSTLSYSKDNPRNVTLNGEAFFKVVKKIADNAKFWVKTDDLQIEVYGTSFNVNNRSSNTKVFLEEGIVALKLKNGTQKKMKPGDLISYSYKDNTIIEQKIALRPELETSWKDGSLIFDRESLKTAMQKIKNTYGLEVVFENEASKNILLTGAVPTQNLDICIKTIEKTAQVTIVNKNNKLHIYKN